jgi:hypothetical protein
MSPDREITSEELSICAIAASKEAIRRAKANGIAYTSQQGRNIVQHRADGTTKIIEILPKAFVKPAIKRYRVA